MGWLVTVAVLVLLAILPLGASVLYDADGPVVRIVAGPLKIKVFPLKKKPKKEKAKKEKPQKEKKTTAEPAPKAAKSTPAIRATTTSLRKFRRRSTPRERSSSSSYSLLFIQSLPSI